MLSASYSDREFNSHNVQGGDPWVEEGEAGYLLPDEFTHARLPDPPRAQGLRREPGVPAERRPEAPLAQPLQPLRRHRAAARDHARLPQRRPRESDRDLRHLHRRRGRAHQHRALRDPVDPVLDARRRPDDRRVEPRGLLHLRRDQAGHALRQRLHLRDGRRAADDLRRLEPLLAGRRRSRLRERRQLRVQRSRARRPADRRRPARRPARPQAHPSSGTIAKAI